MILSELTKRIADFSPVSVIHANDRKTLSGFLSEAFMSTKPLSMREMFWCSDLATYIEGGAVVAQRITIPVPTPWGKDERELYLLGKQFGTEVISGNESFNHQMLKLIAFLWLRSIGAKEVEYEYFYGPRRGDVASLDLRIVVECGNTPPEAAWRFCGFGTFVSLPYQEGVPGADKLHAYVFRANEEAVFPQNRDDLVCVDWVKWYGPRCCGKPQYRETAVLEMESPIPNEAVGRCFAICEPAAGMPPLPSFEDAVREGKLEWSLA